MDDKQSIEDIRSALWHIAHALKGIELKLDQLETTADMLVSISNYVEEFVDPYHQNSKFSRLVEVIEKQSQDPKPES